MDIVDIVEQALGWRHRRRRHHRRRHHRHIRVNLTVNGYRYELQPHRKIHIMTALTVGHMDTLGIEYLDTTGAPMLTPVTPDSPPVWTNAPSTPPVDTFVVAADGSSAVLTATAAGADTVTLTVIVGGVTFTASDVFVISAAPQVLGSVAITDTIV